MVKEKCRQQLTIGTRKLYEMYQEAFSRLKIGRDKSLARFAEKSSR